jgi:hypothetical protein
MIFFSRFLFTALTLFICDFIGVKYEKLIKVPADLVTQIDIEHNQRAIAARGGLINPYQN